MDQSAKHYALSLIWLLSLLATSIDRVQANDESSDFDYGHIIRGLGDALKLFPNSSLSKNVANLFAALPANFTKLSIDGKLAAALSAVSASGGLSLETVEQFLNASGIAVPSILGGMGTSAASPMTMEGVTAAIASYLAQGWRISCYTGVGAQCLQQLGRTLHGIVNNEIWAMMMLDAMGKPESMVWQGHLRWLGSYDECTQIGDADTQTSPDDSSRHIGGQYCTVALKLPSALVPPTLIHFAAFLRITLGICVPDSCSQSDIANLFTADTAGNGNLLFVAEGVLTEVKDEAQAPDVTCQLKDQTLSSESIAAIVILVLLGILMFLGTLYDVWSQIRTSWFEESPCPSQPSAPMSISLTNPTYVVSEGTGSGAPTAELQTLPSHNEAVVKKAPPPEDEAEAREETTNDGTRVSAADSTVTTKPSTWRDFIERCLLAFSVYSNAKKIMSTNQAAGSLGSIHGIRFLSMAWVILGHSLFFGIGVSDNVYLYHGRKSKHWTYMGITGAAVSVDTFFALSGLLVAYLTLRELEKIGSVRRFRWPMFYFHRFWRLTPVYMMTIMVFVTLYRYFSDGPMWRGRAEYPEYEACRHNWWANLIYLNNLVKTDEMCVSWTWYLANDMQFYVISPLIIIPLFYNKIAGGVTILVGLIVCTVAPAAIATEHQYKAQQESAFQQKDDRDFQNLYIPPYTRMGPYLAGMVTGYLLHLTKCQLRMPKLVVLAGWSATAFIVTSMVYGLFPDDGGNMWTLGETAFYYGVGRTAWGAAVGWIVFACATGYGVFIPLGRLTYCAYLTHAMVMGVYYGSRRQLIYFTDVELAFMFMGQIVASYGVAFIFSLAFESPMMGLEKAIFRREKRS